MTIFYLKASPLSFLVVGRKKNKHTYYSSWFVRINSYPIFVSEKDAVKLKFKIENLWVIPTFSNCEKKLVDNLLNRL